MPLFSRLIARLTRSDRNHGLDSSGLPIAELLERAKSAADAGDTDISLGWYEQVLAIEPKHEASLRAVCELTQKAGLWEECVHWGRVLLARSPNDLKVRRATAKAARTAGLLDEAETILNEAPDLLNNDVGQIGRAHV